MGRGRGIFTWCVYSDPCGLLCFIFGVATVVFVNATTLALLVWPWFFAAAAARRGGSVAAALLSSPVGLAHAAVFQASCVMILWSYFAASTSDPGSVKTKTANIADLWAPADDAERVWKPQRRYCKKCECIKPPRAHHCSTCQRCVNRMDRASGGAARAARAALPRARALA
jgi:hypothetical protein